MRLPDGGGLRARIALCVAAVVLLLGLAGALFTHRTLTARLRAELEERGRSIAVGLEARAVDPLLRGNFFELHRGIQEARSQSQEIRYVFVVDPIGNVIDHTFESRVPADLLAMSMSEADREFSSQLLATEEGFIRDIAVPVFGGKAGAIHLGMAERYISETVSEAVRNLLLATAFALVAGVALAWLIAHFVSRPVGKLVTVADAVGRGDLSRRASITSHDEIGRLGRAFDSMASQLEMRIGELEATNVQLTALNQIAALVSGTVPADRMLIDILEKLLDLVQCDAAGMLLQYGSGESGYRAQIGFSEAYAEGVACLMASGEDTRQLLKHCVYPSDDVHSVDHRLQGWLEREGIKAFVSTPFAAKANVDGALHVARRANAPFEPREKGLLSNVAAQIGIMLANRRLLREASQAEALRDLNQLKSEFAMRASHELRTPATAIKGYIETLLRPDIALDPGAQKQILEDMDEVSDRLNRLIRNVLNVARLDSGALPFRKETLMLRPLLRRTAERLGRQSPRHRVVTKFIGKCGAVLGDSDCIQDILENLITNAFKYTPHGGVVTVVARTVPSVNRVKQLGTGNGQAGGAQPAKYTLVSVSDQGIGIPAGEVAKVFQQFYQVAGDGAVRSGGMGMGLFICKTYVEAMGGEIWAESEEGEGSTFSFTIPAAAPGRQPIHHRRDAVASPGVVGG